VVYIVGNKKTPMRTLPAVTPTQLQLLLLLYKFRFLTTHHFQKILGHKTPRKIQDWLRDLHDKKCIGRHYERMKFGENTKPAIYYLDLNGRHLLKSLKECNEEVLKKVYKEKTRTKKFIEHCLAVADFFCFFQSQVKENETIHFSSQSMLNSYGHFPNPLPDGYIAVKTGDQTKRYFIDIFDESTPYFVLRKRIKNYVQYASDGIWQHATHSHLPSILFVLPNENTKRHIFYYAKSVLSKNLFEDVRLYLTTKELMLQYNNNSSLWLSVDY
jgi:hypothetical protein